MKISIPVVATEQMPIEQIRLNELNSRDYSIDDGIEALGQQLRAGQVQALTVFPSEVEDDYTVLDGHRRLLAARRVGISTLQVNILDSAPSREEQLAFIHSAGSTGRKLRQSELATLVQGALDTLDEESVSARFGVPVEEVRARRVLASASGKVQAQVDAGQVDVLDLLKMDEAIHEFAGTEFAEQVEAYVAAGPSGNGYFDVDGAIARARNQRDLPEKLEKVQAELTEHKAKEAPDSARYGSWLSTNYAGFAVEEAMSVAEHVAASHQYFVRTSDASVVWYWKRPAAAKADPNEGLSPEEIALREAEQAAEGEARVLHAVGTDRRELWLKEKFEQKDPMQPLQARVALVRVLVNLVEDSWRETSRKVLSLLTGVPVDAEPWVETIESNLTKRSWSWLAAALELVEVHGSGLLLARTFGVISPGDSDDEALAHLKAKFGYTSFPEEVAVAEYHAAEAKKVCTDCKDRAETDHNGRCTTCAEEALIQNCEGCNQAMVEDSAGTMCVECIEGDD